MEDSIISVPMIQAVITVVLLVIVFIVWYSVFHKLKARISSVSKTERQRTTMRNFFKIMRWFILIVIAYFLILTLTESFTALGISVGVLGAIIGVALQKPIIGMAAWLVVALRKPFKIGDRISIDALTGDVTDISLSYVTLDEVDVGDSGGDKLSKQISIPTNLLFETKVINLTSGSEMILDSLTTQVTYESDINKATEIILAATTKAIKGFKDSIEEDPFTRIRLAESGVDITVKYYTLAKERSRVKSDISEEILKKFSKSKKLEIAYPHTEIILNKRRN